MSLNKKTTIAISIVLVSTFSALLLLEILLRSFKKDDGWDVTREANIIRNFEFSYILNGLYPSNTQLVNYRRNEYGLRDDCTDPSEIKILTIGGSTTDQRYVAFNATYQKILQNRISAEIGQFGCVTNAGIDGHSTWGHIFAFKNWFPLIPNLEPDYVVFYIGVNDADFRRGKTPLVGFDVRNAGIKIWLKKLEIVKQLLPLYRFIRQATLEKYNTPYAWHTPVKYIAEDYAVSDLNNSTLILTQENVMAFRSRFKQLLEYVQEMGAIPICVSQPHRYVRRFDDTVRGVENILGIGFSGVDYDYSLQSLNSVMSDLCEDLFLDLYNHEFSPEHFYDGVHTTDKGSIYIGELMGDFFIENNLHNRLR